VLFIVKSTVFGLGEIKEVTKSLISAFGDLSFLEPMEVSQAAQMASDAARVDYSSADADLGALNVHQKCRLVIDEMRFLQLAAAQFIKPANGRAAPWELVAFDSFIGANMLHGSRMEKTKKDAFGNPLPASFPWDRVPKPHPETMKILQQTLSPEQLKVFEATP
jgi:hypothetical protein